MSPLIYLIWILLCANFVKSSEEDQSSSRKYKTNDKRLLERQLQILSLLVKLPQPQPHKTPSTYSIADNIHAYSNSTAVKDFLNAYQQELFLKPNEIFFVFHTDHLEQAIILFRLFYYAKDFGVLYKTALWIRDKFSKSLFVYALSTALAHRPDTYGLIIPPIYEISPHYFFPFDTIHQANNSKSGVIRSKRPDTYSAFYTDSELMMDYYLDDVGNSAFYWYCNVYYPFWMDGKEFGLEKDRRGEQYYYLYQQLLARYYLEKLSNSLGHIQPLSYSQSLEYGHNSALKYPNDMEFPPRDTRTGPAPLYDDLYNALRDFERRIRDAIDLGYILARGPKYIDLYENGDGINLLGNVIEQNGDSPNPGFYGSLQEYNRRLLSISINPRPPPVLEHFETALRDPTFYKIYNRIVNFFQRYKNKLPPYTETELSFPGITVDKVDFVPLVTYFDYFTVDISNAVNSADDFPALIEQKRLNHEPFTYKIVVNSDKTAEAIIRIYLGPKFDERRNLIEINSNRMNFVEIDTFIHRLEPGKNQIKRSSKQLYWYIPDRTSYRTLYQKIVSAIDNNETLQLDASEAFYGLPERLLLPKGKVGGQVFQAYVIVNPYKVPERQVNAPKQQFYFHKVGSGMNYFDDLAFGFPFDRPIKKSVFPVPNSKFQDVTIYHRGESEE